MLSYVPMEYEQRISYVQYIRSICRGRRLSVQPQASGLEGEYHTMQMQGLVGRVAFLNKAKIPTRRKKDKVTL